MQKERKRKRRGGKNIEINVKSEKRKIGMQTDIQTNRKSDRQISEVNVQSRKIIER